MRVVGCHCHRSEKDTCYELAASERTDKRLTLPCLRSHEDIFAATDASKLSSRTLVCDGEAFAVKLLFSGSALCWSPAIAIGCCQSLLVAVIRRRDIV